MDKHSEIIVFLLLIFTINGCVRYFGKTQDLSIISSDNVELKGTLVIPESAEPPTPAVLILHGAEPATRSLAYRMHANVFVERGMAALLYDKRGAGESGGDHGSATYAQLVDDALAAVRVLKLRPEIDSTKIGIVGISESGWLTPEIAERSGGVSFVINKVGASVSWRDTNAWELYNELLADGVDADDAKAQVDVFRRLWKYYISPNPDEEAILKAELSTWSKNEKSRLPAELKQRSESYIQDISYDPAPFLEHLSTPMLYIYGSEDVNIPTEVCVKRITQLRNAGNPVSYHVFDGEGHELGGLGITGYQFVKDYSKLLGDFAEEHIK